MAFVFSMPSTRELPTVMEAASPPIPLKSPTVKITDDPFPPPAYTTIIWAEASKPHGESGGIRNRCMRFVPRGASKRTATIAAMILAVVIGLIVGLVVGLRKKPQTMYLFLR